CPISECASSTVTRSSLPTRRYALGTSAEASDALAAARAERRPAGTVNPITRPPVTSALVFRNSRRLECVKALIAFLSAARQRGRALHCVANPRVGAAAAEVAAERRVDVAVARIRLALQQRSRRHDLPGLAVAALHHVQLGPRTLHRMAAVA